MSVAAIFRDLAPAVEFGWPGRIYVVVLLVGIPLLAMLRPADREIELPPRRALYASAVTGIWILTLITALVLLLEDLPLPAIGLEWGGAASFAGWTIASAAAALGADWLITRLAARLGLRESPLTYQLMPRGRRELAEFMVVSASAGFGEELTYHGFLLAGLVGWLGSGWVAALIANLAFGVLHGYQGQAGVVRAALMGYVFCLPVVMGAGLWPAIAGHFLVNALLGLGMWKWLMPPGRRPDG